MTATDLVNPRGERERWYVLSVLTLVYAINIADRFVVNTLIEPIKREFDLSDTGVGLLTGTAVAIFYVTASIPIAALADRSNRQRLLAIAIAAWSVLTALGGLSRSFWQLFVARIGVGVGEAGATPISQSLLSDYFTPKARGFALSLFTLGSAGGAAAGATLGGLWNDQHGWRTALVLFGVIGLPLAVLVALTVKEPERGRFDETVQASATLKDTLRFIWRQRALRHVFWGSSVVTFWSWGLIWWTPTFLLRTHGMQLAEGGRVLGLIHAIGGVLMMLVTAWCMKLFADKDPRYQVWFVAVITVLASVPAYFAYAADSRATALLMLWIFIPASYAFSGPSYALAQNLVPAAMRARTCALILFTANVTNLIVAPVLVGACADFASKYLSHPERALGMVLAICTVSGFWGAWHYWAAARTLTADLARAGAALPDQVTTSMR